jgi:alkanesulfonate monooxygenase SsuD/methylene tetrahydromethanopterin reductase-like flavin-dependent oxidoreductase (luciferase family)
MMASQTKFGVLLPHFSKHCSRERIIGTAKKADELGLDSAWVRDHVFIPPEQRDHGGIKEDLFTEPLLTLSSIGTVTNDLTLGTAILWPCRHPIKLAQNVGTLSYMTDSDIVLGMGIGRFPQEFEALDLPFDRRPELITENYEILNRLFNETDVDFEGELYEFEDVTIHPRPDSEVPLWYGGFSKIAIRRAIDIADGILPGRCTFTEFEAKMEFLSELEKEHDRELSVGMVPVISVAETTEQAEAKLNIPKLVEEASKYGDFEYETKEDIEGYYIAGTPDETAAQIQRFVDMGLEHVVLDMRHAFDEVEEMMTLIADEVIPQVD